MQEILIDSILDCLKLLPFLYLSYLLVEYAEHRMSAGAKAAIYRAGKAGPLLGSLIGTIPQCGFAAAAAGLFAGGVISPGTLLAVFLSTSDEMLPVMLAEGAALSDIAKILLAKAAVAAAAGMAADFLVETMRGGRGQMPEHPDMCEHGHCGCGEHSIWYSALNHTVKTALFLLVISFLLGLGMDWLGRSDASRTLVQTPVLEELTAGLLGMIPNCAASVLITKLFLEGVLGSGGLFAGLLCGAGTGLLVLWRENRNRRENLWLTAALFACGAAAGVILGRLGIL